MSNMEEEEASSLSTTSTSTSTSTSSTISTATPKAHHRRGAILPGEIRQLFSLPESIIYYIAMNPTNAEVYKKLIRTCKYFYNKNPIFVVYGMRFDPNDIYFDELFKTILSKGKSDESESNEHNRDPNFPYDHDWKVSFKESKKYSTIDMKNIPFKLWVCDCIDIHPESISYPNIAASIIPKIYQCDVYGLTLDYQNLTLDEFLLLGLNAKDFVLNLITITDGKSEVMFEKVIEKLPNIRKIDWICVKDSKCISSATVQELLKLQHFGNIFDLHLAYIPEYFDIKALFAHIKTYKNIKVFLSYRHELTGQYKQQVDKIIDEIITTQVFNFKPPLVKYPGLDEGKKKKIEKLFNRYCNKRF